MIFERANKQLTRVFPTTPSGNHWNWLNMPIWRKNVRLKFWYLNRLAWPVSEPLCNIETLTLQERQQKERMWVSFKDFFVQSLRAEIRLITSILETNVISFKLLLFVSVHWFSQLTECSQFTLSAVSFMHWTYINDEFSRAFEQLL